MSYVVRSVSFTVRRKPLEQILLMSEKAVPLHPVISFSVINYVVSMRRPRESGEVSFFYLRYSVNKKIRLVYPQSLRDSPEGHTVSLCSTGG